METTAPLDSNLPPLEAGTTLGANAGLDNTAQPSLTSGACLPSLVAEHLNLLRNIDALSAQRPDGPCGEFILAEIARNHEEMAWILEALNKGDESGLEFGPIPATAAG